jgi:hypothetical protein
MQIRCLAYLAGGVSFQTEQGLIRGHSFSIVFDADVGLSTIAEFYFNAGGSRVDTVLHQFFDYGNWSLNDFSSSNLVGYPVGKYAD